MATMVSEIQSPYQVTVITRPMSRVPFPIFHETEEGFPPYAVMQRLTALKFAAWCVRKYAPNARRRCEAWSLVTGLAELETERILARKLFRAERRLLADVVRSLWSARASTMQWDVEEEGARLEDLSPALAASLAVRRIAAGSGEVLRPEHIAETRRIAAKGKVAPAWALLILDALCASHEALRGQVTRGGMVTT